MSEDGPEIDLLLVSQPRTQSLSSWGAKTLVDAGHVIC
jgi:hypothetical protein